MHSKARVQSDNGRIKSVFAEGFDDLQIDSLPYKLYSRLNIYIQFLILGNKKSVFHVYRIAKDVCRRLEVAI